MNQEIKKTCKNIPKKYYSGLNEKETLEQCKEIKKSRISYKKKKIF